MSEKLINRGIAIFGSPQKDKTTPIVVVGTARGGTSMVAGALARLGVYMGDRAGAPVYEDMRLSEYMESKDFEEARKIIEEYNRDHEKWGWKRPSSIEYLDDVDRLMGGAAYVFVFKDIFSIAQRNAISMLSDILPSMERSLKQYLKCLEFLKSRSPYAMLLSYNKAVSYPEYFIDALIKFCGLTPSERQRKSAIDFITPEPMDYLDTTRITKAQGRLDGVSKRAVFGWARYVHAKKPATVEILLNDNLIGTITANMSRMDLEKRFGAPCAFCFNLPDGVKFNPGDKIRARVINEVKDLDNSPYIFSLENLSKINSSIAGFKICDDLRIIEIQIDLNSLKRGGREAVETIGHGWAPKTIWKISDLLMLLVLSDQDGREAIWYFDSQGRFIGNDLNKIWSLGIVRDGMGRLFKRALVEVISSTENSGPSLFELSNVVLTELANYCQKLTEDILDIRDKEIDVPKDVRQIFSVPSREVQDGYLATDLPNIEITYQGYQYNGCHGIVINDFMVSYPLKSHDGRIGVLFEGGHEGGRFAWLDVDANKVWFDSSSYGIDVIKNVFISNFFNHIIRNKEPLVDYFNRIPRGKAVILRQSHIGHRLWNDLSALYRLKESGLAKEIGHIIYFNARDCGEAWIPISELLKNDSSYSITYIRGLDELSNYVYQNLLFPIKIGDSFISEKLVNEIILYCKSISSTIYSKSENELRVVFGLRFENRTWINQIDGLSQLSVYLAERSNKLTLIIDGHDRVGDKSILSHGEDRNYSIIDHEKSAVKSIQEAVLSKGYGEKVRIVDAVDLDLATTVMWICSADFFIAPWGAGLAKYKWIANLPGVVFTSRENLFNRGDLKIYEDSKIRENATECVYVNPEFIKDLDNESGFVKIGIPKLRANFYVDVEGIKKAIDQVLTMLEKSK